MHPVNLPSDRDNGHVPLRIASCKVRHDWETAVRYVAEILGLTFETVDFDWNTPAVPADLRPNVGVMKAGTICAHRWRLAGKVGDAAVVSVQYFAALSSTPWPDVWPRPVAEVASAVVYRVAGRPNLRMQLCFDPQDGKANLNSAIPLAAMAAVNAIPFVVEADPGLHRRSPIADRRSPVAGRSVVTRRAGSSPPERDGRNESPISGSRLWDRPDR